jgi:7-keto-8-aminopelargonate synthetase-like enzyme
MTGMDLSSTSERLPDASPTMAGTARIYAELEAQLEQLHGQLEMLRAHLSQARKRLC